MKLRQKSDLTSLRRLQEKRAALRSAELFSYSEELRSVMVSAVTTCAPEETFKEAVGRMAKRGVSAVVVTEDGRPVGILTERDVLRRVGSPEGVDFERPVSAFMTPEPVTAHPSDTVYRALFLLSARHVKHLPLVEGGRLIGIVTLRQLLKLRHPEPMTLIEAVVEAPDVKALKEITGRLAPLAASNLAMGKRAYDVVVMVSLVNQDIQRRAFELALQAAGEPPAGHCLFLTGSHGRLENLLRTDQDHGIVFAEETDSDGEADRYFAGVAQTFSSWLEEIGFRRCPGEVMSSNPIWRKSLSQWRRQLNLWFNRQDPHLGRYVTLFYDSIPVHGDHELFGDLSDYAYRLLGRHHEVLRILHEEEGSHRVPTGLLGRIITERSGEHKGEIDIKRSGLIFVVEGVRILALMHGIRETRTLKRIAALIDEGYLNADDGEYFEAAYRFLLRFALEAQIEQYLEEEELDTYVNPRQMSARDREMLRHTYKAVNLLQDHIATEFGELVL